MHAINLDTYSLSLLTAKEDILNPRASTNWALFAYEGVTNNLKLFDSGAGGLTELVGKFHNGRPMYGLCRVGLTETGQPQIVMVCWVGESVDEYRRTECASHVPSIKTFFKEAQIFITASQQDEVTEEKITAALAKIQPPLERLRRPSKAKEQEETVGTNYRKTNAAMEMRRINRDSFWARAEREEEQRKLEERRRAVEDRQRWERERVLQEKKESEERDRKMNEKLQMIEEQRKIQAQLDAETKKAEKARWEQEQREHEEDMKARLRRSESIEKAAEAAALVSQRTINARAFFRQLSASSQNSSRPESPQSVKAPFRRYQRSLTDTAFIFERASNISGPTSPLSPSIKSPFSRTPSTPFKCPASPLSPSFHTIPSPQHPQTSAASPPTSPIQRFVPPVSPLPSLPVFRPPPPLSSPPSRPPPQATDSASPASPQLLGNQDMSETFSYDISREQLATAPELPPFPLSDDTLDDNELVNGSRMLCELQSEVHFIAKTVLVEEDEEEVEEPEEPSAISATSSVTKISTDYEDAMKTAEKQLEPVGENSVISALEWSKEQELEPELDSVEEPEFKEQHAVQFEEFQSGFEPARTAVPTLEELSEDDEEDEDLLEYQEFCGNTSEHNLMTEEDESERGRPVNGEDVDVSEQSTPERYCYTVNREDEDEIQTELVNENGESSPDRLLRVRALYDYQAEDETEISFEPGDIISDVETIDKAWWRGSSKDGRQGLFPANYVETI
ncbi:drebrin-like protein B isoform X2 [Xyrauchen texanus]|uniref:drebrin-like protein B isoform X2 n=1 Tax=Xyrauchen texanus TaxID=154827 RepID=UPI002241AFCF|nr:drebrin-like protein B isoform X2 [Xyrauchen texanus]